VKQALIIACFTVMVTLFYNYVGQLVPQKEVHPPKDAEIKASMSAEEMVQAGKELFDGKGTCKNCHNGSARFPNLEAEPIGAVAKSRREGMSDVEYLAESIYEPDAFVVPPFAKGMVVPPLTDQEILCIVAYLQSMGGTATATLDTKLKWQGKSAAPAATATAAGEPLTPELIKVTFGCVACHSFADTTRMLGPGLGDVGKRLTTAELYEALLEPDKTMAKGEPPYAPVMGATLNGNGFYDKVGSKDLKKLVEYLSSLKG
jgi:cytochrome c